MGNPLTHFIEHPLVIRDVTAAQFAVLATGAGAPPHPGVRYRVDGQTEYQWNGSQWVAMVSAVQSLTGGIELSIPGSASYSLTRPTTPRAPLYRWIVGDYESASAVSVAASQTLISDAVDVRTTNGDGTFVLHTSGSGVVSVAVAVSDDGVVFGQPMTQATALSAGIHHVKLDAAGVLPTNYLRLHITETGGAASASVQAYLVAQDKSVIDSACTERAVDYVLGDQTSGATIAASATQYSAPIAMDYIHRQSGRIVVTVSGAGTCSLTAEATGNAFGALGTWWKSLGVIKSGMTAGTHTVDLSDAALKWLPYMRLLVTETGGSQSVTVTIRVAYNTVAEAARRPRVLMLYTAGMLNSWASYDDAVIVAERQLTTMGYKVDLLAVQDSASVLMDDIGARYEFVVIPNVDGTASWTTWTSGAGKPIGRTLKGASPIPVFVCGVRMPSDTKIDAAIGAGARSAEAQRAVQWRGVTWYQYCGTYTLTNQSHMSNLETLAYGATQADAVMWRFKGSGGWVYASAGTNHTGEYSLLMHMMAEAVMAGHIKAPPRKLPLVFDFDDMPDCYGGAQTIADMERLYSAQQRLSMPCAWGIRCDDIPLNRMPVAMSDWVAARTADKGGLIYPITHSGAWFWKDGAKSVKDTKFRDDIALCNSRGIRVGWTADQTDQWGYYYFNTNSFDQLTLELASPETAYWTSPDNKSSRAGYGWAVARSDKLDGINNKSIGEITYLTRGTTWHRGVLVVGAWSPFGAGTKSLDFGDGASGTTTASQSCNRLLGYSHGGIGAMYLHGSNTYDGHSGGNAPGTRLIEVLADNYQAGLRNVVQFVHGSELANLQPAI